MSPGRLTPLGFKSAVARAESPPAHRRPRRRFTTGPTSIAGHAVEAGQRVISMILSANRDPRVFSEPNRFRPDRAPGRHLSFGHGVHFCLGAHLARHQVAIAIDGLLHRLPGPWSVSRIDTARTPVGIDVLDLALAGPSNS
ncbi:cytochrome P450 [Actinomadura sp. NPDC023710]|uniref:cytochrome P450 n=1 Tax=Actinomadura sp. NPDC023710 TaxID=3158219 RepID=UPI0033FDFD8E